MGGDNMYAGWQCTYDAVVEEEHASKVDRTDFLKGALRGLSSGLDLELLEEPWMRTGPGDFVSGRGYFEGGQVYVQARKGSGRFSLDLFVTQEIDRKAVDALVKELFNVKLRSSHWIVRAWP
jgi:hypothetical protein